MDPITITIPFEEMMLLPGEAVTRLLDLCNPTAELLHAAYDFECRPLHGKGRWVVMNHIRTKLAQLKNH